MADTNNTNKLVITIIAFFIPPLAVWLVNPQCDVHLFLDIALTILGYFPGLLYALWRIWK